MASWKKVNITFPTRKLGDHIEPVKATLEEINDPEYSTVYGVSNIEGITITGKESSKNISNYIVLEDDCFAFNPYRINVGSIGINDKKLKGCVSPAYVVFKTKKTLDAKFLYHYLKSDIGIHLINWYGNRGGVRDALRYDDLCKIDIPDKDIGEQQKILERLDYTSDIIKNLSDDFNNQTSYLKQLRQSILQEAIEGKLTAEWRASTTLSLRKSGKEIKGNPDYDAAALLDVIKKEKAKLIAEGKLKKEKPLPEIEDSDKPFDLPEGWVWCRLGDVGLFGRGKSKHRPRNDAILFKDGSIPFIQTGEVAQSKYTNGIIFKADRFYNKTGLLQSKLWSKGTLCITIAANIAETGFLGIDACFPDSVVGFTSITGDALSWIIKHYLKTIQSDIIRFAPATAQKNINLDIIWSLAFPLPPLAEQKAIVERVDNLLALVDVLEKQVNERKVLAEELMQSVLREAFG